MRIAEVSSIGRFPTVVHDPGKWWTTIAPVDRLSLNAAFWSLLCDPVALFDVLLPSSRWRRIALRAAVQFTELSELLPPITSFQRSATFASMRKYNSAARSLSTRIAVAECLQSDFTLTTSTGPILNTVNYEDGASLLEAGAHDTSLARSVAASLRAVGGEHYDLYLLAVTSPYEFLTALITSHIIKARGRAHVCLVSHAYENYTLEHSLDRLYKLGLGEFIDSSVRSLEEREQVVPWLISELERGKHPAEVLVRPKAVLLKRPAAAIPPTHVPKVATFTPYPIFWTRISDGKCYWSKCAFCVQNNKHPNASATSKTDVRLAISRLGAAVASGYRSFIFSDEALSPSVLSDLSSAILESKLDIRWACRSKMELRHDRSLFDLMSRAGCIEVLFGLESIVPATQQRMDKFVAGLDLHEVRRILCDLRAAGIGTHVNVISGFPHETFEETQATINFMVHALKNDPNATFLINEFALFVGSPMAGSPHEFDLLLTPNSADMPLAIDYQVASGAMFDGRKYTAGFRTSAMRELGWSKYHREAVGLYFTSGHGCVIKGWRLKPYLSEEKANARRETFTRIRNWWDGKRRGWGSRRTARSRFESNSAGAL